EDIMRAKTHRDNVNRQSIYYGRTASESAARVRPSGSVTLRVTAKKSPFFAGAAVTVICSPARSVSFAQPLRISAPGLADSTVHVATFPAASFTAISNETCGFDQSTFVTTPFNVMDAFRSYSPIYE